MKKENEEKETREATQQLITNVVDNLDDMKGKTEVKEQIDEIDALRKEFHALQLQVRRSEIQVGGLSGSGGGLDPNKIAPTTDANINKGIVTIEKSTDSKNTGYPTAVIKPALTKPMIPIVTILLSM